MSDVSLFPRLAASAFALVIAVGAGSAPANAAPASGNTKSVVVRLRSFIKVQDLDFGNVIAATTLGTVTVDPSGTRAKTGGPILAGGPFQPARFAGEGTPNQAVAISVTTNSITLTRTTLPAATMIVDQFKIGSTPTVILSTTPQIFVIGGPTGIFNFPVGGRLNVKANQPAGLYTGTFTVTLNYQ